MLVEIEQFANWVRGRNPQAYGVLSDSSAIIILDTETAHHGCWNPNQCKLEIRVGKF